MRKKSALAGEEELELMELLAHIGAYYTTLMQILQQRGMKDSDTLVFLQAQQALV